MYILGFKDISYRDFSILDWLVVYCPGKSQLEGLA